MPKEVGSSLQTFTIPCSLNRRKNSRCKTCGDDKVVTDMLQACNSAAWDWSVAFNQWLANPPVDEDIGGIGMDAIWDAFTSRLLSK